MTAAEFLTTPALGAVAGLRHGFFTRRGGVSEGPWAALNCSLSGQDDRDRVRENRRRAAGALGLPLAALHGLTQVHGIAVAEVDAAGWLEGQGPRADAMVTRRPGVALGIVTADCAPVLFADPVAGVIGAAHAGWRGAVGGVHGGDHRRHGRARRRPAAGCWPRSAPASARRATRSAPTCAMRCWPAMRPMPATSRPGLRPDRWQFDLPGYCAARLAAAGVGTVETADTDTLADDERFFSHRRRTLAGGGPIGHQLSAIAIPA